MGRLQSSTMNTNKLQKRHFSQLSGFSRLPTPSRYELRLGGGGGEESPVWRKRDKVTLKYSTLHRKGKTSPDIYVL